jgi:DNA-binding MarR family transcriptional regulator
MSGKLSRLTAGAGVRTIYLIKAVDVAIRSMADPLLKEYGLTMAQYTVLSLAGARTDLSSADIARRLSQTPQSVNEVIMHLERSGLVSRVEDAENRRVLRVRVTAAGRRTLSRCGKVIDGLEGDLLEGVSASDLNRLRSLLQKIAVNGRGAARATQS